MSRIIAVDGAIVNVEVVPTVFEELHRPQRRHYIDRLHYDLEKRLVAQNLDAERDQGNTTYELEFQKKKALGNHVIHSMPKPKQLAPLASQVLY